MKISEFNIFTARLPFRTDFKHSLATRDRSSSVILELKTDDGACGYGEAAPRQYVTGETIGSTVAALQNIGAKLRGRDFEFGHDVIGWIEVLEADFDADLSANPSATCALELALLDLHGRMSGRPVLDFFGPLKTGAVFYSGPLSDVPIEEAENILGLMKQIGFKMVKVKVSRDPDAAIRKVALAREMLGPDVLIRVDANGDWELAKAVEIIDRLLDYGVTVVEQPLAAAAKDDYPVLVREVDESVQVMIDESLCTYADAQWFIEHEAAACFNLKISKNGGLINTRRIYQLAVASGIACQLGCHVGETSILTAAGQIFAGLADELTAYEGAYGAYLLTHDVVDDPLQFGLEGRCGLERTSGRPGLGIDVNTALLRRAAGGD